MSLTRSSEVEHSAARSRPVTQRAKALRQELYGVDDLAAQLPQLRAADMQGWSHDHPIFDRMFDMVSVENYLEVGVWKGMTCMRVAQAMLDRSIDGSIVAVDTWLGGEEHFDYPDMLRVGGFPHLYETFLSNCVHAGVDGLIVPVPVTSHIASVVLKRKNYRADIIYIDASHEYEDLLSDLRDYAPLLREGGLMFGDDYHATWPGVIKAARQFASENDLRLSIWSSKFFVTPKNAAPLGPDFIDVTDRPNTYFDFDTVSYVG